MASQITTATEVAETLENWRNFVFETNPSIPLCQVEAALSGDDPLLKVEKFGKKWVIVYTRNNPCGDKGDLAVFSTAARIQECAASRSGTYVPSGQVPPESTPPNKIVTEPNYSAKQYIRFEAGPEYWKPFSALENAVTKSDFPRGLRHKDWQDPNSKHGAPSFGWIEHFLFFSGQKSTGNLSQDEPIPHLWVQAACMENKDVHVANGAPSLLRWNEEASSLDELTFIGTDDIRRGDIVWMTMTFFTTLTTDSQQWLSGFRPIDWIKVKRTTMIPNSPSTPRGKRKRMMPGVVSPISSLSSSPSKSNHDAMEEDDDIPPAKRRMGGDVFNGSAIGYFVI